MDRSRLITRLQRKEGYKLQAYQDSLGYWTICVGHLLGKDPGYATLRATPQQCDCWLSHDIAIAEHRASSYPFYAKLSEALQNIMIELAYNLGDKLHAFVMFLHAMQNGDYREAGQELKNSLAYKQEKQRFDEIINALETGEFPA